MQNKRYKLLKWYPSLPKDWQVGMEVGQGDRGPGGLYSSCSAQYSESHVVPSHVERNADYWQEIKEVKLEVPIGTKFVVSDCNSPIYTVQELKNDIVVISIHPYCLYEFPIEVFNSKFTSGTWTIYKEKEFEILHSELEGRVLSVIRTSDQVIFKLGDKVVHPFDKDGKLGTIKAFKVCKNINRDVVSCLGVASSIDKLFLCVDNSYGNLELSKAVLKKSIFLDELGNELYEGDNYYFIVENDRAVIPNAWEVREHVINWNNPMKPMLGKVQFKYKKDADKWLVDNKPTFSRKQVLNAIDVCDSYYTTHDDNYFVKVSHLKRLLKL